jgi:TonB family protein
MMSSKNNGFTASDIERYHSGEMLPEERHALEKAALDDPFLADALEGYAFTSTPSDDLAKIQSRLEEKKDRKKVIPIFQRYRWLSVAAIVLIIAGAGWFALSISKKENNASITALEKKLPVKDSNSTVASPQQNSIHDSANDKTTSIKQESLAKHQSKTQSYQVIQGTVASQSKEKLNNSNREVTQINNAEIVSSAISTPSTQNEVASVNGRYLNNQRGYTNMNNAVSPDPRLNNATNDAARKKLYYKAENNNADVIAKVRNINTNDTIKDLNIVLQPLPGDSLSEIVVGYGKQKKSTEKYPIVIIDTLEPAEGYVHFDDYVASNLKMPEELKTKTIAGEVQLSFDVDKDGKPTNIAVVKSLCEKCDQEAIRLLKEGPKWKKVKNKKGKITIKF